MFRENDAQMRDVRVIWEFNVCVCLLDAFVSLAAIKRYSAQFVYVIFIGVSLQMYFEIHSIK